MVECIDNSYGSVAMDQEWEKRGYFWWHVGRWNGDLIYNTCTRIIDMQDDSDWAKMAIIECATLLQKRIRWPEDRENEAKGYWDWYGTKLLKWLYIIPKAKARPKKDITRDPFIAFYAACEFLNMQIFIKTTRMPLRTHRFTKTYWWWRKLIRDPRKKFVKRLDYYRSIGDIYDFKNHYPEKR